MSQQAALDRPVLRLCEPVQETDDSPEPRLVRDVVLATRVDALDAEFIHGACQERGITMAAFLREAAIEWANR